MGTVAFVVSLHVGTTGLWARTRGAHTCLEPRPIYDGTGLLLYALPYLMGRTLACSSGLLGFVPTGI